MSQLRALALAAVLAAPFPALAEEAPQGDPLQPGPETLEGVADILRETLARLAARLEPWREQLAELLSHPDAYEAPVILPNGDILIRRKPEPSPPAAPDVASPERESLDL